MRHITLGICIGTVLMCGVFSCGARQPKADPVQTTVHKDTTVIKTSRLSAEEYNRIYGLSETFYDKVLLRSGFNGSFLVAKDDSIVFEKCHGNVHFRKGAPIDEHSAFHLASVSKTFTAMVVLKLMEQGKISLDTGVNVYLPSFPYPGVTVKMLLNHRSGLPDYSHFMPSPAIPWNRKQILDNQGLLAILEKYKPAMLSRPGKHFHYCNTNYALLALIVEKVTNLPFPVYMHQTIFEPLGMNDTYVCTTDSLATAMPSFKANGALWPNDFRDGIYGDKNVYSTTRDLLKWDHALRTNFLSPSSLDMAYSPYSFEKPGIRNYGLGWHIFLYPGEKLIFHNGNWHGNNASFMRLLREGYTIIALGNRYDKSIYHVQPLAEALSGHKFNVKGPIEPDQEDQEGGAAKP